MSNVPQVLGEVMKLNSASGTAQVASKTVYALVVAAHKESSSSSWSFQNKSIDLEKMEKI